MRLRGGTRPGDGALRGVFAALLATSALSLLATASTGPRDRGRAFGAIVGAGAAVGPLAGGFLTEYLNRRWCLYVNVPVALIAFAGAVVLLAPGQRHSDAHLDVPGALLGSAGMLSVVYGFSGAEPRGWGGGAARGEGRFPPRCSGGRRTARREERSPPPPRPAEGAGAGAADGGAHRAARQRRWRRRGG
ncbi:MFS transporter [Streptomyces sp. MUM 2J]|uniref:MFS transporter n=1 Tax=unclassified Streptomyces TaxID=2593676 RepID=UPI0035ABD022|nr:MFS transporter [Streptomyces sp. MUM 2J]MCH0570671.1 MFS transporter [Streptomyces sp. MUM 136J]